MCDFLREQSDMLRVGIHEHEDGRWDVCLRIDGTYAAGSEAIVDQAELLRFFADWIRDELSGLRRTHAG